MSILNLLKEATHLINKYELSDDDKNRLKDILCYLSEWRNNNPNEIEQYPQLDFVLYNASRKLRTFGYNRLNKFDNKVINSDNALAKVKDNAVDNFYRTESGFVLDKAQKDILDTFENANGKIFLSAPTSFGKTFLLKEIIYRHHENYNNIVIVLPTVALLIEVTEEINDFNEKHNLSYSIFNSIYKDLELSERNIFILTPERVLRLLAIKPDIKIDFFFFDEIYKIDEDVAISSEDDSSETIQTGIESESKEHEDNHRTVAFRVALYILLNRCEACYLAGPFIALKDLKTGFQKMLQKHEIFPNEITFSPTLKNEIDFHGKTYKYKSAFLETSEKTPASKSIDKLIYVSKKLQISKNNQAIVYCLFPAYTEKNAREYIQTANLPENTDEKISSFLEHLLRNYNFRLGNNQSFDSWDFLYALKHQIGIHNGKFPKYFQREVMNLFNDGRMEFLFCTSTIVEGVNTNAKTVVVFSNPSGKTEEGKKFLLLNINGRAGRYQHHFVGNIVYLRDNTVKLINCGGIALDFKPYNQEVLLSDLDLENISDDDLSSANKERKDALRFDKSLLPDEVFFENCLIERKKQERILRLILQRLSLFCGIETASITAFIKDGYFEEILKIWAEIGEIKSNQIIAIKYFSIKYAENSYQGVLQYEFNKFDMKSGDPHKFANEAYRTVFRNVKDTIEYQLPRIISLFESLINRAYQIKGFHLDEPIDFSKIIRFFEVGATTLIGTDMIEKGVPVITVKKVEKYNFSSDEIDGQRRELKQLFSKVTYQFDPYEIRHINAYIQKYCS